MPQAIRVKLISPWFKEDSILYPKGEWRGLEFITDLNCRDYDWAVVYDELPPHHKIEQLACDPAHTILITQEPPTIKVHPPVYTRQFNYVLSSHAPGYLRHPHHRRAEGCLVWLNQRSYDDNAAGVEADKTLEISAVFSSKAMQHTAHFKRITLARHIEKHLANFDWYGYGVRDLKLKYQAVDPYRYHLAVENYIQAYHWSEKLSDALLSLSLPFYAGDPRVTDLFPQGSIIPIPIDKPEEALRIIQQSITEGAYERHLPALREARQLVIERYNTFAQIHQTILEHQSAQHNPSDWRPTGKKLYARRLLRKKPWNTLGVLLHNLRCRALLKREKK